MTKKELLELPAFKNAKGEAQIFIHLPYAEEYIPTAAWLFPFADGSQNILINVQETEDRWQCARIAAKILNKMELGVNFYGNLFPYLRKRGRLEGYCELVHHGKMPVWLYDTEGIAELVRSGNLDYKQR